MKKNTLINFSDKSEGKHDEPIIGTEPGGDSDAIRAGFSDDGNMICFTDKSGRSFCVGRPMSEAADCGKSAAVRTFMFGSPNICPCCGCHRIVIEGKEMYFDPRTGTWCAHH